MTILVLTRRGRAVARLFVVVSLLTLALAAYTFSQSLLVGAVAGTSSPTAPAYQVIKVLPGETLWSIAREVVRPGEDIREVVDKIVELNSLESANLLIGQRLTLPA